MASAKNPYKLVDGSHPISTLLYDREELVASQDGVGLYDGKEKTPGRQNGSVHLTSHRMLYIDSPRPRTNSIALSLSSIKLSEFYAGFMTSSAKITLYLKETAPLESHEQDSRSSSDDAVTAESDDASPSTASWICPVCSYSNPAAVSDDARPKCALCGVPRDPLAYTASTSKSPTSSSPSAPAVHRSPSMPALRQPTPIIAGESASFEPQGGVGGTDGELNACPACTYLNHRSMKYCEICGTPLTSKASSNIHQSRSIGSTPAPSSAALPSTSTLRISFRKGGEKQFYSHLKRVLNAKAWNDGAATATVRGGDGSRDGQISRSGIQGIFDTLDLNARTADSSLQGNLHDLEVLMSRAKEMVDLASSLNAKLTAQEEEISRRRALFPDLPSTPLGAKSTQPEEVTFIRSSLAQLGLPTVAVTHDMVKDENEYHEELAKELAGILTGRSTKGKGLMGTGEAIIGLDEVWGGWNRARGIALVPPSSLLMAASYLPRYTTPPIVLRVFRSGLRVLHTPKYGDALFTDQLIRVLSTLPRQSATTVEIAMHEQLSVGLAEEMLESVEDVGKLVRDEGAANEQASWYVNIMDDYQWDGQLEVR